VYNTDQLPLPSTRKARFTRHSWLETPDSRNEPRPRNDLSAALTKQNYIRSAPNRTCAATKFRDYEQAVSIDNKNTKWQDSTEKEFVRLMNMKPSMTKEKDINLALSTEDTCTSHTLSNMTVATRHVSWQEDISLKHPSILCTHQSYPSEASV
jgi:hypothetical protein